MIHTSTCEHLLSNAHPLPQLRRWKKNHQKSQVLFIFALVLICNVSKVISLMFCLHPQIRRPYFHAKALEKGQLKNWKDYLDFEITNGTHERVVVLFERCLIACALYEDYWIKVGLLFYATSHVYPVSREKNRRGRRAIRP